jgi:hypothetical protein
VAITSFLGIRRDSCEDDSGLSSQNGAQGASIGAVTKVRLVASYILSVALFSLAQSLRRIGLVVALFSLAYSPGRHSLLNLVSEVRNSP